MSKMNTEKKLVRLKLSLNRETLRTLSAEWLEGVAGGWGSATLGCSASYIFCPGIGNGIRANGVEILQF